MKTRILILILSLGFHARAAERTFEWQQTETSLTLRNGGNMVWQHQHDRKVGKPCLRFGLLDGTELTRPIPIPDGYLNSDHVWHRGLWWSWKYINGINFWEENHPGTDPVEVEVSHREDGSARIAISLDYHLKDQPPLAHERRVIDISAPDDTGSYHLDWRATFSTAGNDDVVFNNNSYCGFSYRGAAEFSNNKSKSHPAWVFHDAEGRENNSNDQRSPWVAFTGTTLNDKPACIAIFDHPTNPRHPTWWQTRNNYPYFNPTFTCKEDYVLKPGMPLTLRYRVLIRDGATKMKEVADAWSAFAEETQ